MWKTVKLGDVCTIKTGRKDVNEGNALGQYPFFTCAKEHTFNDGYSFDCEAILIAGNGAVGQTTYFKGKFEAYQRTYVLSEFEGIESKLLLFILQGKLMGHLSSMVLGNTIPYIKKGMLQDFEFSLPPLAEQERIVAKLDAAFAEIDESIRTVKNKIKEISSLYENAVTAEFSNIADCLERKLSDVCEKITDGTHQTPKYFDEGYIFLSSKNVTSRKIDWDNVKYIDEAQHIQMHKRIAPRIGDVLLAKNGTTGVAAIVDRDIVFDIYVSLAWLRSKGDVLPEYLLEFVNSKMAKEQFTSRTKGIGVPNLHLKEIREVIIRFPEEKEKQELIVKKLKNIDDACSSYRQINERKLLNLAYLKSAILSQELQSSEVA